MNLFRTLLNARASAWQHAVRAACAQPQRPSGTRSLAHERRITDQAQTRLMLYASGVGR